MIFRLKSPVKRATVLLAVLTAVFAAPLWSAGETPDGPVIWETALPASEETYHEAVETLLRAVETERGSLLRPGERGKAALKIYTGSGPGLATPKPLVRAVIHGLRERGFEKENIVLLDLNEHRLRRSGFLPPLSDGRDDFEGHPVWVLDRGEHFHPDWYYDSPLPPRNEPGFTPERRIPGFGEDRADDRKSHLAAPLILDVDFWINLPMFSDHRQLGLNGALVNASLSNAGNTLRFFNSSTTGPAAVAEIAAIPELRERWALTLASLERVQFIGGPVFNSLYTTGEPVLVATLDPVLLDARVLQMINQARENRNFSPLDSDLPMLDYAQQVGLGSRIFTMDRKIRLDSQGLDQQVR